MDERQRTTTASGQPLPAARSRAAAIYADVRQSLVGEGPLVVSTVVGLAFVCLCAALIAALIDDVSELDSVTEFDHRVLSWVLDHRTSAWTAAARTVTHLGDTWVIFAVTVVVSVALFRVRRFRLAWFVILATSGVAIASSAAKQAIDRARPPTALWLGRAWGPSFPSGHATQSIACWGALAIVACALVSSRGWRAVYLTSAATVALVVGASRIYLGVHWFSDVVCGWALAALWLAILVLAGWSTPRLRTALAHRVAPPTA